MNTHTSTQSLLRPRLLDVLADRHVHRLITIVAGAGFGKSTLLTQAVGSAPPAGCLDVLVRCTARHAAVSQFAGDVLAGLPGGAAAERSDPRTAADLVRDAVWSAAPLGVCLVLDDVHRLPAGSAGHELLQLLLERLPGNGHLVLASRTDPGLPAARLAARGEAAILLGEDLAFTRAELASYADARGVDRDALVAVGGWPALAELVAATGGRHVGAFLWDEVLAELVPEQRRALGALVDLGGGDDEVLTHALGGEVRLESLMAGVPLVAPDTGQGPGWWRAHSLWGRAFPSGAGLTALEAARGAQALRAQGRLSDAVRVGLAHGLGDEVAAALVAACSPITPLVPEDVLRQWYDSLGSAARESPAARLVAGTMLKATDPDVAAEHLRAAASGFRAAAGGSHAGPDVDGELAALLGAFHIGFAQDDLASMRGVLHRWGALADAGVSSAATQRSLGRALLAGDLTEVAHELTSAGEAGAAEIAPTTAWLRAHVLLLTLGDAAKALAWADEALRTAPATLVSSVRCERIESLRLLGRFDEAHAEVAQLVRECSADGWRSPRHVLVAAVLAATMGELGEAAGYVKRLREVADSSTLAWAPLARALGEAMLAASAGDDGLAREHLQALSRHPMSRPEVLLRLTPASLPLQYVLDPASREAWSTERRGVLETSLRLARAVADLEDSPPTDDAQPVDDVLRNVDLDAAQRLLPGPWAARLAVHAVAGGNLHGVEVVQALGPGVRPHLRAVEAASTGPLKRAVAGLLAVVPARPRQPVSVRILGPLRVLHDGVESDDPHLSRDRVRQLVGYLAVRRSATRTAIAAAIWPDLAEGDAARNLRVTLNYVQHLLEPTRDEGEAPFFLRARGSGLSLVTDDAFDVDLWTFEDGLAAAARADRAGDPTAALAALLRATDVYRGDLLIDLGDAEWLETERDVLRRRFVAAVLRAGHLLRASGDAQAPEELALRALSVEPWSEAAYGLLVATLLDRRDTVGAARALDRCFEMLTEMGVQASSSSIALADRLRRG